MAKIHKLPILPYSYDALEPHIDAKTMEIHHTKHHQAYVDNLNKALSEEAALPFADMEMEELLFSLHKIPSEAQTAVRNNAGGHFNHTLFWHIMAPKQSSTSPVGQSAKAIDGRWGSFAKLQEEFSQAALKRFGSGWVWLMLDAKGTIKLTQTAYQDCPLMEGLVAETGLPILGLDVWEHAYYLKYQNRRADYVKAWWNVVNWEQVEKHYQMAKQASVGDKCGL
jgi:Fe-Mn family superoxide dismutase